MPFDGEQSPGGMQAPLEALSQRTDERALGDDSVPSALTGTLPTHRTQLGTFGSPT